MREIWRILQLNFKGDKMKSVCNWLCVVFSVFIIFRAQPCVESCIEPTGIITIEFSGAAPISNHNGIKIFSWDL